MLEQLKRIFCAGTNDDTAGARRGFWVYRYELVSTGQ